MCGISGVLYRDKEKPVPVSVLQAMNTALVHRGPDDEGFFMEGNIGIGSRRLSIIDLQSGHMPIHNEDKTVWLVFNGEIYNFKELRENLIKKGHVFYTKTDTEVIVHLYEEKKEECLEDLHGMFAFALYDKKRELLFLARDRFGEKPLYYAATPDGLYFASELKAMLKIPEIKKEIDREALKSYLFFEYVPSPFSIIKGVQKCEPATYLLYKDGRLHKKTYWTPTFHIAGDKKAVREEEHCENIMRLLSQSVRRQMISDVPIGVFLSGGVDSSALAALAAEIPSSAKLKTFSIGFREKSYDESEYAKRVARHLGTEHYEDTFSVKTLLDILPQAICGMDEPFADSSFLPTYLLSQFARKHVTVALGGEGGDELFHGYPTFMASRIAAKMKRMPRPLMNLAKQLTRLLPVSYDYMSLDFKLKQLFRGVHEKDAGLQAQLWLAAFLPSEQEKLFSDKNYHGVNPPYLALLSDSLRKAPLYDDMDKVNFLYLRFYLAEDLLFKVDRASMQHSLEVRAPFLDVPFAQYALGMPHDLKLRGRITKYIFKKTMREKLPPEILTRGKQGFAPPVAQWLASELRDTLHDVFDAPRMNREGLFNHGYISRLVAEHVNKKENHRKLLWTLLVFELWKKEHVS